MPTVREALRAAVTKLDHSDSADLDAQLLLTKVLDKPRSWLYAWPDYELTNAQLQQFQLLTDRRREGEPVAYLCGKRAFWNIELKVAPAVLIPRPETELLVELALELGPVGSAMVADLGTGSGAIALALAGERPAWQLHATDNSDAARQITALNCTALALSNVQVLAGSWCDALQATGYQLILSNPPYIDASDPHLQQSDVRFEPRSALVADEQGLADLRQIAGQARNKLAVDGWLLLEHGWQQGAAVRDILHTLGYQHVATRQDHGQRDRVTLGRWTGTSL
ncbi:MAG: peptide chain release factor N(5)-glutamine methyltransferase [Pseudomonadota bacterium]